MRTKQFLLEILREDKRTKGTLEIRGKEKKKLASKDSALKHSDVERRRFCLLRK